jgi:hypothetical protein
MFAGNFAKTKNALFDVLLKSILRGWAGEHKACWTWASASEIVVLDQIKAKVLRVTEQVLSDFIEIPVDYCGWVSVKKTDLFPHKKIIALTLAELETFWSTERNRHQERRFKSIKVELTKDLLLLETIWSYKNEKISNEERADASREARLEKRATTGHYRNLG